MQQPLAAGGVPPAYTEMVGMLVAENNDSSEIIVQRWTKEEDNRLRTVVAMYHETVRPLSFVSTPGCSRADVCCARNGG
jgi:hypothetical protein